MAILVAVTVFIGALCVVNLLFTLGVIRRLREHTEQLAQRGDGVAGPVMAAADDLVGEFTAATVDGDSVSREELSGMTLVAFFSPTCEPCKVRLPEFTALAGSYPGGRHQVLAVVAGGDDGQAAPFVTDLSRVGRVVRDKGDGAISKAFAVRGFPAFALVGPGGVVRASTSVPADLPVGAVA
jgi:thiol-disulfide isomerase/thioredoxin